MTGRMGVKAVAVIAVLAGILTAVLLALIARVGMMPVAAAYEATLVDRAFDGMVKVTVPIFSAVLVGMLYCVVRFRARKDRPHEEGLRIFASRGGLVETVWILASLVLTLGLAAFGAREFRLIRGTDRADLDVQVNASQWSWEFFYPQYNEYGSSLLLPRGRRVRFLLTSKDVVHSFWVPEFRLKQDALPGKVVKLLLTPTRVGAYQLLCAELCGKEHTIMTARVNVMEPEEFESRMKGEKW